MTFSWISAEGDAKKVTDANMQYIVKPTSISPKQGL